MCWRSRGAGVLLSMVLLGPAWALASEAAAQLDRFSQQAGRSARIEDGRLFFRSQHGGEWSCASCHGETPTQNGRHASTGKVLPPLAPAFNAKSLSDAAKVDKWFRRNCKDVVGRECSAGEKADVLAWLISIKP